MRLLLARLRVIDSLTPLTLGFSRLRALFVILVNSESPRMPQCKPNSRSLPCMDLGSQDRRCRACCCRSQYTARPARSAPCLFQLEVWSSCMAFSCGIQISNSSCDFLSPTPEAVVAYVHILRSRLAKLHQIATHTQAFIARSVFNEHFTSASQSTQRRHRQG